MTTRELLAAAKEAKDVAAGLSTEEKNGLLLDMADALEAGAPDILAANEADVAAARDALGPVMVDRLTLTGARIRDMAAGLRDVAALPDPLGGDQRVLERTVRPNGLVIEKVRCPMGVIAIIYESRPNVTSDAAALCLKAGSACVLRGGKEAIATNRAVVAALHRALAARGLPAALVSLVEDTTRQSAKELMEARGLVDLLIPRGGAGLIRACVEQAKVPCIETGTGICHIYVDKAADPDMALSIVDNAKTSRPSVCNAAEVCLVHKDAAAAFLPRLAARMAEKHTRLRVSAAAAALLQGPSGVLPANCTPAGPADFDTEFLDYILAVDVVDSLDAAVAHIAAHSTGHSEAIITEDAGAADAFCSRVDSAAVYVNASTRFTDGGQFGLGCEMGISTQKLGARGPMGLRELTSYRYIVHGTGQVR